MIGLKRASYLLALATGLAVGCGDVAGCAAGSIGGW